MKSDSRGPIRVGIVGLGRAGLEMHLPELANYPEIFKVVAVCDTVRPRRDQAVEQLGGCRSYRSYSDLLADNEVELVDIATRSDEHLAHALVALKTKRWVVVEKPMATSYADAIKLRAASVKAGNKLFVRHNRRFEPGFNKVREIAAGKLLGNIYDIKLRRGNFSRRDDWQAIKRCGGGQLLNWGTHIIDHALQLMGTPPVQMFAELKRVAAVGDAEDYVRIILRNNVGISVDIEVSGGRVVAEPECIITGTRGALSLSGNLLKMRYLSKEKALPRRRASVRTPPLGSFGTPEELPWVTEEITIEPSQEYSMHAFWYHLYAAIRRNKPFPVTLDQAVEVMRIVDSTRKDNPFM